MLVAAVTMRTVPGQQPQHEPTRQEITRAYKSKSGEGGTLIPGTRWERWRIREIRGWALRFRRVSEKRGLGILTRQYRVIAKKNGSCAEYRVTDTIPLPPNNPQIKPTLVVEPVGVAACR
jgi:hypothetical protein